jgi:FimV-like protein
MSLPGAAKALGLGDIRVDSALNEPLSAQIDIVGATRDELIELTAKVANTEIFQHYGADRPAFLSSASFKIGMDSQGRPVLNVRSTQPFTDPVVNFLVDLHWGNGELIREYSLLLDPSGFSPSRLAAAPAGDHASPATDAARTPLNPSASDAARMPLNAPASDVARTPFNSSASDAARMPLSTVDPQVAAMTQEPARRAKPTMEDPAPATAPATASATAPGTGVARYRVAARDTLRGIVRHAGARSESDARPMMIAIFRANPHAFEGNINRLLLGAVLRMPSAQEVAAIDGVDARREVRAHMTAWRMDGRPAARRAALPASSSVASSSVASSPVASSPVASSSVASPSVASRSVDTPAAAAAAIPETSGSSADAAATNALRGRVRSLQDELDSLNRRLASENAAIHDLRQLAASPSPAPDAAGAPHPASAAAAAPTPAEVTAASQAIAASPTAAAAAPTPDRVAAAPATDKAAANARASVDVMNADNHPAPLLASVAPASSQRSIGAGLLGPVAIVLAVLLAGFAYSRRRLSLAKATASGAIAAIRGDTGSPGEPQLEHRSAATPPPDGPSWAAAPAAPSATGAVGTPRKIPADQTTQELAIDAEALEKSYLDALSIDTLGIEAFDNGGSVAAARDSARRSARPGVDDSAGLDTVALDLADLGTAFENPHLNTAVMEFRTIEAKVLNEASLEHNLVELDSTLEHTHAQHVQMPSQLHDHAVVSERRVSIIDALKSAIDRDPNRRDLRMKLLETYYNAASINRRAFLETVKPLSRDRESLTADDWQQVVKMGQEIAADDILFANPSKDDLADCA